MYLSNSVGEAYTRPWVQSQAKHTYAHTHTHIHRQVHTLMHAHGLTFHTEHIYYFTPQYLGNNKTFNKNVPMF